MLHTLTQPSLPAIRVRFIQEKLKQLPQSDNTAICVVATGRTGSGKSTLGNRLVGIDYFLESTGHQDCTDAANIILFPSGLKYVDLPGVSSDEQLENYNRAALNMQQVDDWPKTDRLTLVLHDTNQRRAEQNVSVASIPHEQLRPDLIFYLVAPHHQLQRSDIKYIVDLLKEYGHEHIIYVFNLFTDKERGMARTTTAQNVEDARAKITRAHGQVNLDANTIKIVEVNCWTGQGMTDLVVYAGKTLGESRGKLFEEIMRYQQEQTPDAYAKEIKKELIRIFASIPSERPQADTSKPHQLKSSISNITKFLEAVRGHTISIPNKQSQYLGLDSLIDQITQNCIQEVREVVTRPRSRAIYDQVPTYKEIVEDDYNRPIYREETKQVEETYWSDTSDVGEFLESIFDGNIGRTKRWRWKTVVNKVHVGYHTKTRKEFDGYERVYSHTEYWEEPAGTRLVNTLYHPFGVRGIALLAAHSNAVLAKLQGESQQKTVAILYEEILTKLQTPLADCHNLPESKVIALLNKHIKIIFSSSFDQSLRYGLIV